MPGTEESSCTGNFLIWGISWRSQVISCTCKTEYPDHPIHTDFFIYSSCPRWLKSDVGSTGDQEVAASIPATSGNNLSWRLIMEKTILEPASVAQLDAPSDWRPGGRGFNPRRGRQHSFVEIDHEIFSTVILSLPLIQEGQLFVSGERMCTIPVNRLED